MLIPNRASDAGPETWERQPIVSIPRWLEDKIVMRLAERLGEIGAKSEDVADFNGTQWDYLMADICREEYDVTIQIAVRVVKLMEQWETEEAN